MRVAILTAGAAGMYCGSCMRDNTLTRALQAAGVDAHLIPAYTPIRTDEEDQTDGRVFMGALNVYLDQKLRVWRRRPGFLGRLLDAPRLLRWVGRFGAKTDAAKLGELTLSVLRGEEGNQRREVLALVEWLAGELRPDVVNFSNALLVGVLRELRRRTAAPVLCTLQGDDLFLDALPEPYRSEAMALVRERVREFDGFVVFSRYYRDFMADYLAVPAERIHVVPLGIDLAGHKAGGGQGSGVRDEGGSAGRAFTVGYLARICPEKGLHVLVEAFRLMKQREAECRLRVAGYLGARDRGYFDELVRGAKRAGAELEYVNVPGREEKIAFLQSLDVLSVPAVYREPKGLYVLEALANGVPVVQPSHGAFPEMIETSGGGVLVAPENAAALADALLALKADAALRAQLGAAGLAAARHFGAERMAEATLEVFAGYVDRRVPGSSAGVSQKCAAAIDAV